MKKILLNLFVIYHLTVVVFSPNIQTYLGQIVSPWISAYAGVLALSSTWSFFAPDPGPPPVFLEWELLGDHNAVVGQGQLPELKNPFWLVERQNRRFVVVRSLFNMPERYLGVFGPYLCRTHSEIKGVRLWKSMHTVPSMQEILEGKRQFDDGVGDQRSSVGLHFCEQESKT